MFDDDFQRQWGTYLSDCQQSGLTHIEEPSFKEQASQVWPVSQFAFQQSLRFLPFLNECILQPIDASAYENSLMAALEGISSMPDLQKVLREFRYQAMLHITWTSITNRYGVKETCDQLSRLADALIRGANTQLKTMLNIEVDLGVIAMGKLGGFELNFSSDIDLIFVLFEGNEGEALKLARQLIKALDENTQDGFVYRVDMRLRPFGDAGPLVIREKQLLDYYAEHGRDWERYAMMKGRFVIKRRSEVVKRIQEYIYHTYADYTVRKEVMGLYQQIQAKMRKKGNQENIKLGPGGIREAEFIVQSLQLIHAGKLHVLREASFLKTVTLLVATDVISHRVAEQLESAYLFLRDVENKLQMQNDRQTQVLPRGDESMLKLAVACGFDDLTAFKARLKAVRESVSHLREKLLDLDALTPVVSAPSVKQEGEAPFASIKSSGESKELLDKLIPFIYEQIARSDCPDVLTARFYDLLKAIATRKTYLALLLAEHEHLPRLTRLFEQSDFLAKLSTRIPRVLSFFLNAEDSEPLSYEHLKQRLQKRIAAEPDLERQLDVLRDVKQAQTCRIAISDLENVYPIMRISDFLSELAVASIKEVEQLVWHHQVERFGFPEGIKNYNDHGFAIIAYGKLGGIELSYTSDLDLVFLYQHANGKTTGERSITNGEFYAKMVQRLVSHCQAKTMMGELYSIDARLRPSGSKGLLVSSIEAFDKYQQEEAWTWEHQALLRARPIFANLDMKAQFEQVRKKILCQQRDPVKLKEDVLNMREKMREVKAKKTHLIDLKQIKGGIVDIEFMVQYMALKHAHDHPSVVHWTDNIRILESLAKEGLLDQESADDLMNIYRRYRNRIHRYSLTRDEKFLQPDLFTDFRERVLEIWNDVFSH